MSDKVVLFVPVYNEAETLFEVLSQLPQSIRGIPVDIVVADDCSVDDSAAVARKFTPHVISSKENLGVGAITRKGLCYISDRRGYGKVIKLDGDGQHDVNKVPFVEMALDNHRVVVCSRFHPESDQSNTPVDRILLNLVFANILRRITQWSITDARSGFMGFCFEDVSAIASQLIVERYGIPMELLLRIWHRNQRASFCEIPHPALYGGDISEKMKKKYSFEKLDQKSDRLRIAYEALLAVILDLGLSKELLFQSDQVV